MTTRNCTTPFETASFEEGELSRALERFDWLADELRDEVHAASVEMLQDVLADADSRVSAKERALVMLGLQASAAARATLAWFDASGEHWRVRLLHRLARRECERRRQRHAAEREPGCRRAA
jgi:hypothetical protein